MKEEVFYRVVAGLVADAVGLMRQIRDTTNHISSTQEELRDKIEKIMATQEEEAALLQGIKTEFGDVLNEINAKIAELQAAIAAAGATSPEVDAATADLKSSMDAALEQFKPPPPPTPTP